MIEIFIAGVIQTILIIIGLRLSIRDKMNYLKGFIVAVIANFAAYYSYMVYMWLPFYIPYSNIVFGCLIWILLAKIFRDNWKRTIVIGIFCYLVYYFVPFFI